jgi:hypothetical protein
MRNKLSPILASCTLILAILACNVPGGQGNNPPDLAGTITAQAQELQAASATTAPANTSAAGETPQPADTPQPANPPQPVDTPRPATPAKPGNFKADGAGTTITFSWDDKSTNEDGFRVYQNGITAPIISVGANTGTGGMSSTWTGQACGFKAQFYVRAYNNAGESQSSKTVDGVTVPCQPGNLTVNQGGNAIEFHWGVAAQHSEDGFHIYQQGVTQPVASRGPNKGSGGTIFTLDGQVCNLVGTYYVTAFNSAGESPPTNLVQSETVPCGPSGFTITNSTKDVINYSFTDNGTSETGFHLYVDDVMVFALPQHGGTGTVSSDWPVQCDFNFPVNHVLAVRAFNYAGESTWSEHVGTTTPQC